MSVYCDHVTEEEKTEQDLIRDFNAAAPVIEKEHKTNIWMIL